MENLKASRRQRWRKVLCAIGLLAPWPAAGGAAVLCATSAAQIQTHLTTAEGNGVNDEIRIAAGTYAPTATYNYTAVASQNLTISGGWNSTCASQRPDPALTVLDGQGARQVMSLNTTTTTATVAVRFLTFHNGNSASNSGGGLSLECGSGGTLHATVEHVVARGCTAPSGGGLNIGVDLGTLRLANSLVVGNVGSTNFAGVVLTCNGSSASIVHNTIADNTISGVGTAGGLRLAGGVPAVFANNILWGNEGTDLLLANNNTYFLYANDVESQTGTSAGGANNVSVDPQFIGGSDYRLGPGSTLIDAGDTVNATLPALDIVAGPRNLDGGPDLGAYESEHIFSDGFECGSRAAWSSSSPP